MSYKRKILVVDDEGDWLKTIENLLAISNLESEYELEKTENPSDAIVIAKKVSFDLVILDQHMSIEGTEVLKAIKSVHTHQNAIIMSGINQSSETVQEIEEMGATFIYKSLNFNLALIEKIQWVFERDKNPVRIFISYTNPDFEKVMWIYYRLKDKGFHPWIDKEDLLGGVEWDKAIQKAIDESDFFLSCLSDIAVKRMGYFQKEVKFAVAKYDKNKEPFIIPLRFENTDIPKEFAKRKIQHISFDIASEKWWENLLKRLISKKNK